MKLKSRGIVVVASSRAAAEDQYRSVAKGEDVVALVSEEQGFVVLSSAESNAMSLLNPSTGEMGLEANASVLDQINFVSESSAEDVETNYTVCASGCGGHIIFDDAELVTHCPACATEIQDLTEDQIAALAADDSDELDGDADPSDTDISDDYDDSDDEADLEDEDGDGEEDDMSAEASDSSFDECEECHDHGIVVSAASFEEAKSKFISVATGELPAAIVTEPTGSFVVEASAAVAGSPFSAEEDLTSVPVSDFEARASESGTLDAHYYICSASDSCGAHVISESDDIILCPECLAGVVDPNIEEVESELDSLASEEDEFDSEADDKDVDGDDESSDDVDDSEDEDESEDFDQDASDEGEDASEDESDKGKSMSVASEMADEQQDDGEEATASTQEPEQTNIDIDLVSVASMNGELSAEKLDVVYAGSVDGEPSWYAYHAGMPIARATASTVQDKELFGRDVFGTATAAHAKEHGVNAALEAMGFVPLMAQASVQDFIEKAVQEEVESQATELSQQYERKETELTDRFQAALATAATGINRGFFADLKNPVKSALVSALSVAGVKNPEVLVDRAFENGSDQYNKSLVAKASEIMDLETAVQNQLTDAVAGAAYIPTKPETFGRIGEAVASSTPADKSEEPAAEATASTQSTYDEKLNIALKF